MALCGNNRNIIHHSKSHLRFRLNRLVHDHDPISPERSPQLKLIYRVRSKVDGPKMKVGVYRRKSWPK